VSACGDSAHHVTTGDSVLAACMAVSTRCMDGSVMRARTSATDAY
jgi:hypothetical protein